MIRHTATRRLRLPNGARPHAVVWDERREAVWRETGVRLVVAVGDPPHVARFLKAVWSDLLSALWWLVALRGPRRGEIAGLCWEDIDPAAGGGTDPRAGDRDRWPAAARSTRTSPYACGYWLASRILRRIGTIVVTSSAVSTS